MSLKYRQLSRIKDAGQNVVVRLKDGTTVEGSIVDLDQNDVCIQTGAYERVLSLDAIIDVKTRTTNHSIHDQLQIFAQSNTQLDLHLQSGELIANVAILDLEILEVLVKNHNQERLIAIDQIAQIVPATSQPFTPSRVQPSRPTSPVAPIAPAALSEISYPTIRSTVALLEQQISKLVWPVNQHPEIIKDHPAPPRTNRELGKVWSRALNYISDYSWKKAAEEFARYAVMKPDSFEACYNAAVCWLNLPDYRMASVYFDYGIERDANTEIMKAAITTAQQVQYWHRLFEWLLKYLQVTKGTEPRAFLAFDFGLKFGMYRTTVEHLGLASEAGLPMDWLWCAQRLAYVALRYPNFPGTIMMELEQMLSSNQADGSSIIRISESLFEIANDSPSSEYRTAQQLEEAFYKQNPSLNLRYIYDLKTQLEELRKEYKFREAREAAKELLTIIPGDMEIQRILRDLEMRLAPPPPVHRKAHPPQSNTSNYNNSIFNAAKKAEQRGDLDKALKLYQDCIAKKDTKWQSAVMDLAGICLRLEEIDVGVKYILEYQDSLDPIASNNMLGALYFKGGRYEEALASYREVVELKSTNREKVAPLISIAMIRIRQSKIDEAEHILKKVLRIQPNQSAAKGLIDRIRAGTAQTDFEIDNDGYLVPRRVIGVGTVGIGQFLEYELENASVVGLDRAKIEKQNYTLSDAEYLEKQVEKTFSVKKPDLIASYRLAAAKVLDILGRRDDKSFHENLTRFCAANGDFYAVKNFDVARTYYLEAFQLEDTITSILIVKFIQLLMTFLYGPDEFLESNPDYKLADLLQAGLGHQTAEIRLGMTLSILNISRRNPDIINKMQSELKTSKIRNLLVRDLCELLQESVTNSDYPTLLHLLEAGHLLLESAERELESKFRYFAENSTSRQLAYDMYPRFIEWQPDFIRAGVDFSGTDSYRIEGMKNALRQYIRFVDETIFEEKDNLRNVVVTYIQRIQRDIEQFPTYYSRTHMLPLLDQWYNIVESYFEEIARSSKPNLDIIEVAKATYDGGIVSAHLVISNAQGKSAASGIKLEILPSPSDDYEIIDEAVEFAKTLRASEQATIVVQVRLIGSTPAFTLNYVLSYTDRQGEVSHTQDLSIAVRLNQAAFAPIPNPYARWASSNEVTDPQMFFGRDQLVSELIDLFCVPGQRKMIVIHGQKRAGKSSILYHVKDRIDQQGLLDSVIVCAFKMSIGDVITSFTLPNFFLKLAKELHRSAKDKLAMYGVHVDFIRPEREMFREDPFDQFIEYTEELVRDIQASIELPINLLMIIDEFTYVYELIQKGSLDPNFMKAWKALVERHIFSFLLSGIDEMPEFVSAYPNEFAVADLRRVSYLDPESSRNLIEKPVWDYQHEVSRFQERAIQRIQELTGDSAYYIQIFNNQLVEYMNEERTGYITEADIDTVMRRLTYGRNALNLASNFDNLTRFKNSEQDIPEVILEGRLLRLIAFLTKSDNFAHRDSILRRFRDADHLVIERLISRLIDREVLIARAGSQQYAFVVDLFKEWLNANLPYEEGMTND